MKTIAFIFMIYDKIEKEDIWYKFFMDTNPELYSIYIHSKNEAIFENDFFKQFVIEQHYDTAWGTFSLVYLQNRLLDIAIKNNENYKFIFISDTHIPLHNFNNIYNILIRNNNSYFNYHSVKLGSSLYSERICSINNYKNFNIKNWVYGSQWCILNRDHVLFILNNEPEFILIFSKSVIPDEFAYINFLKHYDFGHQIHNNKTTFVSGLQTLNPNYRQFPHTFDNNELNIKLLNKIKKSYLFLRKIVRTCIIEPENIFAESQIKLDSAAIICNYK